MDVLDKKLLLLLSGDIPTGLEPYKEIARQLHVAEDEVLRRIDAMQTKGLLKRIAPIVFHHKTVYQYNALTAWQIPDGDVMRVAEKLMSIEGISHVYERKTEANWRYNVYGMVHGRDKEAINKIIEMVLGFADFPKYKVVYTTKEWKKTSPNLTQLLKDK